MPSRSKTKQTLPPRKLVRKIHPPEERQDKSSMEGSPAGNKNDAVRKKRKSPNNKSHTNPKHLKAAAMSNSKAHPLTMADIPDIVTNANWHEKPPHARTSRQTLKSDNRTNRDDLPSDYSQSSSDEERVDHEDFGVNITAQQGALCASIAIHKGPGVGKVYDWKVGYNCKGAINSGKIRGTGSSTFTGEQ